MGTVTERRVRRVFAKAPSDFFLLGNFDLHWSKAFAFVGTVAKGLVRRKTAGTPPINSGFHFHDLRGLLTNVWLAHGQRLTPRLPDRQAYSADESDAVFVNRVTLKGAIEKA